MSDSRINPYQSPETPPGPAREPTRSRIPIFFVITGAVAYHLFILVLLDSTAGDRKAGITLLANTPLIIIWCFLLGRTGRHGVKCGFAVIAMQGIITAAMILQKIGDVGPVLIINGIIALIFLAIVYICWHFR